MTYEHDTRTPSHDPSTRRHRGWAALLVALALTILACGGTTSSPPAADSGTPTAVVSPTASATSGPTPVPFAVSGVSASASPSSYYGTCSSTMTFNFSATISVPPATAGGTVTYHWFRSDGATGTSQSVAFNAGDTSKTVTTSWQLGSTYGTGATYWEAVQVSAPNAIASNHATFSFVCQSSTPFQVSSVNVSVSPSSFTGACSSTMTFNFSATINVPSGTPGGTVSYHWIRSDGASTSTQTVHFNAGETHHTVTTSWSLGYVWGTGANHWEAVQVTAPNALTSSHANFSFVCQFKVTGIHTTVSPTAWNHPCASSQVFTFSATISVGATAGGSITYKWLRSDGASTSSSVVSVPAGATSVTVSTTWTLGSAAPNGSYWEQVSVSSPNAVTSNQATFTKNC